ncbi:MAG: hypothetical protein QXR90_00040 [Sulfolobales archaeon]
MARISRSLGRGLSGLAVSLIILLLVVLFLSSYLISFSSNTRSELLSRSILQEYLFEASSESVRLDMYANISGDSISSTYVLRNTGSIPITIVRIWVNQSGSIKIYSIYKSIQPGDFIDLNTLASDLGLQSPGYILFMVTARGSIIPVSEEYMRLSSYNLTGVNQLGTQPTPASNPITLTPSNLSLLVSANRIDAYFKRATDVQCNLVGQPQVDILDPILAPYKALMIWISDQDGYSIRLSNGQSACNRYVIRELVAYASQGGVTNNNMYISTLVGIYARRSSTVSSDDRVSVSVFLSLIDRGSGSVIAQSSQTIVYILYSAFSAYYFTIPVFVKLDDRFLDPNYLNGRYFDLEISVYLNLYASGGNSYTFKVGVVNITFLGADLRL